MTLGSSLHILMDSPKAISKDCTKKDKRKKKGEENQNIDGSPEKIAMEMEHLEGLTQKVDAESSDDDDTELYPQYSSDEDDYLEKIVEESMEVGKKGV
ncbi:hypothetical protein JTB14_032956 [Gonioctena quinquepunctata]|nr:hypothetical protein JTB14_032956 [Gonioctena quinquepunctata]